MINNIPTKKLIEAFLNLQERYSFEKRHLVTADRYVQIHNAGLIPKGDYTNSILRESLLEHVGHLPVLATFLHPYVEHSADIDLGRVLYMLAIHDIGETITGDVFTYDKTSAQEDSELKAAMSLLELSQQAIYSEYEERSTLEAKYAKAIDALAPVMHSMYYPQVKIDNFRIKGAKIKDMVDHKKKYFIWDRVLDDIFDLCTVHYLLVESGGEGIFATKYERSD